MAPTPNESKRGDKAENTRDKIAHAAMTLFRRDGYDATTMRAVAAEAGVSLGNAYYYFSSKEHLIQAFYDQLQRDHAEQAADLLGQRTGFADRLEGVLLTWVDIAAPSHAFAAQFFKNAADPSSPLSPFSAESEPSRESSIALYRQVVDGADVKLTADLRRELPELLWLLQMGLVLFWVYDASPKQQRTRLLASHTVPIIDKVVRSSRLPVIRGVVDDVLSLVKLLSADPSAQVTAAKHI